MLSTYREVLRIPGALKFSSAGFLARLPIAIVGLGIVIYISGVSGSYAIAGILAAAFQLSAAGFALVTSRLVDHHGQHTVLPILVAVHALALIAFIGTVQFGLPLLVQGLTVAIAGASQPAIGAVVRARWAYAIGRQGDTSSPKLRGAFALESIIDELIFTLGPLLVATMALHLSLSSPLVLAAIVSVAGVVLLAAQRSTEPPPSGKTSSAEHPRRSAIRLPGMPAAVLAAMGLGFIFGSYEVTAIAFTERQGAPAAVGLVLALWAMGSMAGGLWFGSRHWKIRLPTQALICAVVLVLVLIPQAFIQSVPMLVAVTFLSGAAVAPALISGFSLAERLVPNVQLTEGLTWSNSGLAVGFSGGAAVAGLVIDSLGTSASFALPVLGALFSVAVLAISRGTLLDSVVPYRDGPPGAPMNSDPVAGPAPGAFIDDAK
jgi:MFS family permease